MAKANFLELRGTTYYVRLDIPSVLRDHYGKRLLKKSLRTSDLATAKALSNKILAEWRIDFQRVLGKWSPELGETSVGAKHNEQLFSELFKWRIELYEAALPYREIIKHSSNSKEIKAAKTALTKLQSNAKAKYGDTAEIPTEEFERVYRDALTYKIRNPEKLVALPDGETGPVSQLIEEIVQGKVVPRSDLFRPKLLSQYSAQLDHVEIKTRDMRLGALKEIAKFFKATNLPLDKTAVAEYLKGIKAQALTTKKRKLATGKLYYDFLREQGLVPENAPNPFSGHAIKERLKEAAKARRQPFKRSQVEALYTEAIRWQDQPLADCILIGAYTGMRVEEICQLTPNSVDDDLLRVNDSKTKAGLREIPIHPALAKRIKELSDKPSKGFLIPSDATNKYGRRSDTISKRFATIRTALGFGSEHVFHSIRKTVATLLEHAGVTESVAADIMGHEKPTMTFGLYSGGSSMEQRREAIEKLSYNLP